MLKNIVYCPVRDNILVEGKIPPSAPVPSGTQCEEENILSLTGQGWRGGAFLPICCPWRDKKNEYFFWNIDTFFTFNLWEYPGI